MMAFSASELTSDLMSPIHFTDDSKNLHLMYTSSSSQNIFHPEEHFGCNVSNRKMSTSESSHYSICSTNTSHLLVSPIIFSGTLYLCDKTVPSVVLDKGLYAMFSLNRAVIPKEILWSLGLLVFDESSTDSYLFLLLVTQKLLWITGNRVKLSQDTVKQRFSESMSDAKFMKMVNYVDNWACKHQLFIDCIRDILERSADRPLAFLSIKNVQNILKWLKHLSSKEYSFPSTVNEIQYKVACKEDMTYFPMDYSNSMPSPSKQMQQTYPINNIQYIQSVYKKTCKNHLKTKKLTAMRFNSPWIQHGDILLIIVFNKPHYESIPFVELIYRPFFPNMLFCGPTFPDKQIFPYLFRNGTILNRSFITYKKTPEGHSPGSFNYECTMKAIQMQYHVQGYLTICDDMLVWLHHLHKFPKAVVWFLPEKSIRIGELKTLRECRLGMCDFFPHWNWWEDYQEATFDVLRYMKQAQYNSSLMYHCYNQLVRLNGAEFRPNGAYSDIYYIPHRLANDFAVLSGAFLRFKVFLEIAVPTILRCIEPPENVQTLEGIATWDPDNRDFPWLYFDKRHLFGQTYFHPCKWGYLKNSSLSANYKDFLCNKILPYLHDPYERIELIK